MAVSAVLQSLHCTADAAQPDGQAFPAAAAADDDVVVLDCVWIVSLLYITPAAMQMSVECLCCCQTVYMVVAWNWLVVEGIEGCCAMLACSACCWKVISCVVGFVQRGVGMCLARGSVLMISIPCSAADFALMFKVLLLCGVGFWPGCYQAAEPFWRFLLPYCWSFLLRY